MKIIQVDKQQVISKVDNGYKISDKAGKKTRRLFDKLIKVRGLVSTQKDVISAETVYFDETQVIEKIYQMKRSVFMRWYETGGKLLIGARDFAELMHMPELNSVMNFAVKGECVNERGYRQIMGMDIVVIPWMEGMVIVPDNVFCRNG